MHTNSTLLFMYLKTEDHPNFLAVIIETNPQAWALIRDQITFKQAIQAFLVFMNGHIAMNNLNQVCVIASHTDKAQFLYPNKSATNTSNRPTTQQSQNSNDTTGSDDLDYSIEHAKSMYKQFRDVDDAVTKELKHLIQQEASVINTDEIKNKKYSSALSGALSMTLAYLNKVCTLSEDIRMRSRILILSVTGDLDSQYIPIMNCIFAAQTHVRLFAKIHYVFKL